MQGTATKRQKEQARLEHRQKKDAEKAQRKKEKSERGPRENGVDPDIAGIVPGPQPLPEGF
ncbi:MAG: hypothetical protein IPJ65_18655 [Archangiaceae bacterium]|nr:hypothetical protein [Archangiaceae bacterium]